MLQTVDMMFALYFLQVFIYVPAITTSSKVLTFPSDQKIPEMLSEPRHFAVLQTEDPRPLPEQFSICSSILIEYVRDYLTFLYLKSNHGSFWFTIVVKGVI